MVLKSCDADLHVVNQKFWKQKLGKQNYSSADGLFYTPINSFCYCYDWASSLCQLIHGSYIFKTFFTNNAVSAGLLMAMFWSIFQRNLLAEVQTYVQTEKEFSEVCLPLTRLQNTEALFSTLH